VTGWAGAIAAAAPVEAGRGPRPVRTRPFAGPVFSVAVAAASALAAGAALVGAGVAWVPPREGGAEVLLRGAEVYAAECAGCHGARLEGRAVRPRPGGAPVAASATPLSAPPLGASGHAWRHADAELAAIVAHGAGGAAKPDGAPGMPAFAGRLGPDEIDAVLAHVKSRWPAGVRAYQAALNRDGGEALAALLRDPAWTFPGECLTAPSEAVER
jgi:mono/diheme cytochrome c family protein